MLRLYLAWRLVRLVRRALLVGAVLAWFAATASGLLIRVARTVLAGGSGNIP